MSPLVSGSSATSPPMRISWLAHRHAGLDLLRPELAELYDAFETPRAVRGEIEMLWHRADARDYLAEPSAPRGRGDESPGSASGTA